MLAAKNFGLKRVILPKGNEAEALELKPTLTAGLQILYVERFDEVFDLVFGGAVVGAATPRKKPAVAKAGAKARGKHGSKPRAKP